LEESKVEEMKFDCELLEEEEEAEEEEEEEQSEGQGLEEVGEEEDDIDEVDPEKVGEASPPSTSTGSMSPSNETSNEISFKSPSEVRSETFR